jgi:hypothetical protein
MIFTRVPALTLGDLVDAGRLESRKSSRVNAEALPDAESRVRRQPHDQVGDTLARDCGAGIGKEVSSLTVVP